jgi:type VI secretion system protein ImpK
MTSVAPTPALAGAHNGASPRRGQLALTLQEAFTAVVRLRSNRQVAANVEAFRAQMKHVLAAAEQEARRVGYAGDDVRYALFALIAFIDESVLNSPQPMFADWGRRPLQEEVFGGHTGGELFFQYLQQLLGRQDSEDLADVLEVYQLCLLLGFKGRYSVTHGSELQVIAGHVAQKIERARGSPGELSPRWRPSTLSLGTRRDRLVPRLAISAGAAAGLAAVLFLIFSLTLGSGASGVRAVAAQVIR